MMTDTIQITYSFPHSILQHARNRVFTIIRDPEMGLFDILHMFALNIPKTSVAGSLYQQLDELTTLTRGTLTDDHVWLRLQIL